MVTMSSQKNNGEFERRSDWAAVVKKNSLATADDIIDHYANILLDGELPEGAREKFVEYMNRDKVQAKITRVFDDGKINTRDHVGRSRGLLTVWVDPFDRACSTTTENQQTRSRPAYAAS